MQKIIAIAFFLVWGSLRTWAQSPGFVIEKYTTANGLTDNSAQQVLQDSRGFLWIGCSNGLNRYDGKVVKQYNNFGKNGLTDLAVSCLAEDADGNIWIGTSNGLNKLNPFTETITHYYEGAGAGTIPYKWCNYLYVDKDKNLWLTTEKGLALYNISTNSFQNFPVSVFGADPTINKFINRVLEDSKGRFWLATSYGVKLFNRQNKTYQSFYFPETNGKAKWENVIISLFEDHNGTIWAGTWGGGLLQYNTKKNIFEKQLFENIPSSNLYFPAIAEVNDGSTYRLLVVVNNTLYYLNTEAAKNYLEEVQLLPKQRADLSSGNDSFSDLITDRQGNIWACGSYLCKLKREEFAVRSLLIGNNNKAFIYHIVPDIKNPATVFYLSSKEGWWKYDALSENITAWPLPLKENGLLKNINDWQSNGIGYWFTSEVGFGYYDIYNKRLTDLSALIKEKSGQLTTTFITIDKAGKIWLTMRRSGILVYDPLTKKSDVLFADIAKADNIFGSSVTDLKFLNGNIYCCAAEKLYKINPDNYAYTIIHPPAYEEQIDPGKISPGRMVVTKGERLLFSSSLRIYELKKDSLVIIFPATGLSAYTIENFEADAAGNMWVQTSKGIFKTDTLFKQWTRIPGIEATREDSYTAITTSSRKEILFNGKGELIILKDSLLPKSTPLPAVIINRIKYGEKQDYLVSLKEVNISSSYKDAIDLELSAIDFKNENKILYQLDGWDNNWSVLNGSAIVRYEQLPSGNYLFKTKTVNTRGEESKETLLRFAVIPPFYRTWWFITLLVLSLVVILFLIYHYRLQKAVEMEKLRTRIATDLHDDIGATLSSISMYSQAVKNQLKENNPQLENVLDKMGENSRDMVTSMSDIVWAINPGNDDGQKLIERMENYVTDICAVKNILLHFNADEKLGTTVLPLEHRKNIYLIFKEAVNNAVKYSAAKNIWVEVRLHHKSLTLIIKDDGEGFDEMTIKKGNGLKNLQLRAKEIRGTVTVQSLLNEGTTVCLNCSF